MPRFAANLSIMYAEHAFLDRFAAAARDGFDAVEYLFPYAHAASELAARLDAHGLQQVLFNGPPGDWDRGERGLACLPGREDEFRRGFLEHALPYAQALRCPRVHLMAGIVPAGADAASLRATYVANLAWAVRQAPQIDLLLEPINTRDIGATSSTASTTPMRWCRRSARPTSRCRWTCTTVRSSKATWR